MRIVVASSALGRGAVPSTASPCSGNLVEKLGNAAPSHIAEMSPFERMVEGNLAIYAEVRGEARGG